MATVSTDEFDEFVKQKTQEYWDDQGSPYLLTYLSPDFTKAYSGASYKEIILPFTLKEYLAARQNKFKIVQHPTQKAKVGIIPPDKSFDYNADSTVAKVSPDIDRLRPTRKAPPPKYVVLNFLELLARLDKDDINSVNIPMSVIAKLLSEK